MKILISAYACETGRGGEGEIAWRIVLRLAENNDVWVITRANLRSTHDEAFRNAPKPERLHFIYFDLPWIFRFYKRGRRLFLLYYYFWQVGLAIRAAKIRRTTRFAVMLHLTGGMDWMPSGLALLSGKFVWGPVGSENTNPEILKYLPLASIFVDRLRLAVRWCMRNLDPLVRLTGFRANVILTHTIETMPKRYSHKLRAFTQTGIESSELLAYPKDSYERNMTLRLIFAGELKDWKGGRLALNATLRFFEVEPVATLRVIGDGPLRKEMEAIVKSHPQGRRVTFLGKLPMDRVVDELHEGDVFLYPSYHHGLATIVLQAMLTGLPIVCIEGDAISRTIGSRAGIAVRLFKGVQPEVGLTEALLWLARNEADRQRLAMAARAIAVNEYNYNKLAKNLEAPLRAVVYNNAP